MQRIDQIRIVQVGFSKIKHFDQTPGAIRRVLRHGLRGFAIAWLACVGSLAQAESDPMLDLLAGEFAIQAGDKEGALAGYADAARATRDPAQLERAVAIALYAGRYQVARELAALWEQSAQDLAPQRARAWAELGAGDEAAAQTSLLRLLAAGAAGRRAAFEVLQAAELRKLATRLLPVLKGGAPPEDFVAAAQWVALAEAMDAEELALAWSAELVQAHRREARAWRLRAQVLLAYQQSLAARDALAKAVELAPEDEDLRLAMAALLDQIGASTEVAALLRKAKEPGERLWAARVAYAAQYEDADELKRLDRELQSRKWKDLPARVFLLGQVAELRERPLEALPWYLAVAEGPQFVQARFRVAVIQARELKDLSAMRATLAALRGPDLDEGTAIDTYLLEGELLGAGGSTAEATAVYDAALLQWPNDERLLYARAMQLVEADDIAGVERDLRRILSFDPDHAHALNALGYTLADRTDRREEALLLIERALALDPNEAAFIDSMGWIQYRMGNLEQAVDYLRRAYELLPDGEVAAHLGEALWVSGEREEANKIWSEALQRSPEDEALLETIRRLNPELNR